MAVFSQDDFLKEMHDRLDRVDSEKKHATTNPSEKTRGHLTQSPNFWTRQVVLKGDARNYSFDWVVDLGQPHKGRQRKEVAVRFTTSTATVVGNVWNPHSPPHGVTKYPQLLSLEKQGFPVPNWRVPLGHR